jgi:outer membrane biogenesis lipoprotein LolB
VKTAMSKLQPALMLCALLLLGACSITEQTRRDLEFGYKAWQEDKRPALPDEEYGELDETGRALYMPEARKRAREAFWSQALKTAGASEE